MTGPSPEVPAILRLFYALPLPEVVARKLQIAAAALRRWPPLRHCRVRWVPEENLHVTLRFLGPLPQKHLSELRDTLDRVARPRARVETRLAGFDAFPSVHKARILVAALEDPEHRLAALAATLETALAPFRLEPERRPFVPHVTLARLKEPRDVGATLERATFDASPFTILSACLFESELDLAGARYRLLHRADLAAT